MFKKWLRYEFDKILTEKISFKPEALPSGYHPAQAIIGAARQAVIMPWGNSFITVIVRTLGAGEMPDVDLIKIGKDIRHQKDGVNIAWISTASKVAKAALVSPTYKEIEQALCSVNPDVQEGVAAFRRLEKEYAKTAAEKKCGMEDLVKYIPAKLWNDFCDLSLRYDCLLPANTLASITAWVYCYELTDVKKVTDDALIEAYCLAKQYNREPADFFSGVFLEKTRKEINIKAFMAWEARKPSKNKKGSNRES